MNVIPPIVITDAIFTSSAAPEPAVVIGTDLAAEVAWVSGTTYAIGDIRIYVTTNSHRKYQRVTAGAGTVTPLLDATNWSDIGPTNAYAMYDLYRNSQTVAVSPATFVLTPGKRITSLAMTGLVATSVRIRMVAASVTVYDKTISLNTRTTTSWSTYYFGTFILRPSLVRFDLPPYTGATITIDVTNSSGSVKIGSCVIGTAIDLGYINYEAENDTLNFSTITRDTFGNSTLVPKRNVPKTNQTLTARKDKVNAIRAVRDLLNAVPAVWSGLTDSTDGYFEAFLIVGVYKKFTIKAGEPQVATISLELEEV